MRLSVILFLGSLLMFSCVKQESEALVYYRNLTEMHNELIYQVHLSLNETRSLIASHMSSSTEISEEEIEELSACYDSVASNCNIQKARLEKIGPLDDDSLIYSTFLNSIYIIEDIYNEELSGFLAGLKRGVLTADRLNVLYSASMKLASAHIDRVESILDFNEKYELNLDTLELILSKSSTEKFQANISIIHNSVPIAGNTVNGYGQLRDVNGSLYTGQFKNGLFHGEGKLEYPDGDTYEGEFKNGGFGGYGKYTWNNGSVYEGQWRDDLFNGIGTMISQEGDTLYGYWLNGVYTKL